MTIVLSPATLQVFSYLAHEKKAPATIAKSCRTAPDSTKFCKHIAAFMKRRGGAAPEAPCTIAFRTLERIGLEKEMCVQASNSSVKGQDDVDFRLSCPINSKTIFGQTHVKDSDGENTGYVSTAVCTEKEGRLLWKQHAPMMQEFELVNRLNETGKPYGRSIADGGAYTVLKFLNDVEADALDVIVEHDAPELKNQVKKFNANTKFTYRSIDVDVDHPPHYEPARRPRDLLPTDFPVYSCSSNPYVATPPTIALFPANNGPL